MVANKCISIANEDGTLHTYNYCANDLADEVVGMWVCNDGLTDGIKCSVCKTWVKEQTTIYAGCTPGEAATENVVEEIVLVETLNKFLTGLDEERRKIFVRRYWYMSSVREIADDYEFTVSKVKMSLMRTRNELRELLEKEWIL